MREVLPEWKASIFIDIQRMSIFIKHFLIKIIVTCIKCRDPFNAENKRYKCKTRVRMQRIHNFKKIPFGFKFCRLKFEKDISHCISLDINTRLWTFKIFFLPFSSITLKSTKNIAKSSLANTVFCLRVSFYATEKQVKHIPRCYDLTDHFCQKLSVIALNEFLCTSNDIKSCLLALIIARIHIFATLGLFRVWGKCCISWAIKTKEKLFFQEVSYFESSV